ncbi:hypothetical protein HTVC024P_gp39 [Pelagibacter phage HTVC024P]|nr:hypothetical protein HTVC024P_gp39 [Pelagibacter phage HTVC024P]
MAYTTIKKPSDYFNTVLFDGDSSSSKAITVGFRPDLTWQKSRNVAANFVLIDQVRGATKVISSDTTASEDTVDNGTGITTTNTGIIVSEASDWSSINRTGRNIVSWNWLGANGTASNTDGSISSTVSANTTSGFSIVKYTGNATSGATVGHGLGVTPKVIIIKGLGTTYNWIFGHNSLSTNWTNYLTLSTTDASAAATNIFNDTAPTSSVFSIGNALGVNTNSSDYIAYCFAEKTGYSKFGSWTGNGNADGPFVYTGFKPEFVILKNASGTNQWLMFDNAREPANVMGTYLEPNSSAAEANFDGFDFLSNGIKMRTSNGAWNTSGSTYIYMAFAEEPLVGDNPATAR